jgi:hypothetical protein
MFPNIDVKKALLINIADIINKYSIRNELQNFLSITPFKA